MDGRSGELRVLAQRVADALPPEAEDVVLTGSTSRGIADEHSDVELLVVAPQGPTGVPIDDPVTWTPPVEGAWWVGGRLDGVFVELVWWTLPYAEERVRALAAGELFRRQELKTAEALLNGIALRGERHAAWCARLAAYPDGLAEKIIADVALEWLDVPDQIRGLFRPGDALALGQTVVERAEGILRLVFALNREWEPGWKRLEARVAPLEVKPDRLAERIDASVRALDLAALRALARETLELAPRLREVERVLAALEEPL